MEKKTGIIIVSVSLIIVFVILIYLVLFLVVGGQGPCGDGVCNIDESWQTCPEDCPVPPKAKAVCGDGVCEQLENRINCPADCGLENTFCGDGVCEMPETEDICPEDCTVRSWILDYDRARRRAGISGSYLKETRDFDYSSRNIMELVYDIKYSTGSAEEAVKKTAREVYSKVSYVTLPGQDCARYSASEILARGYGLCSTMTKVNVAILRGMGIAARPVVGCATNKRSCQPLAILPGTKLPKIGDIRIEDGKGVVGGGLHAWVEVWLPEKGWVLLESTAGIVYKSPKCTRYDVFMENPSPNNLCWISDMSYVRSCKDDSLFK